MRSARRCCVAMLSITVGISGACGAEERGDRNAFCASVALYVASVENGLDESADDAFTFMREQAPGRVHEALVTMDENPPNSARLSEQEAFDAARSTLNDYIRNDCDLDVTL